MQVKVASPEESGRIAAHEKVHFFQRKLRQKELKASINENVKCRVVFERSYIYIWLLPELMSKLERLDFSVFN